jgi:hypothetical protein
MGYSSGVWRVEEWRVTPKNLPVVWRHCSGCGETRVFICSEKFRVNAQKKVIDVWLIYRCRECDTTWNYSLVGRTEFHLLATPLRDAFMHNDSATARRFAADVARLRQHGATVECSAEVNVERTKLECTSVEAAWRGDVVRLKVGDGCDIRLDRLLSMQLGLSRNRLPKCHATGQLLVMPKLSNSLRKPIRNEQRIGFVGGIDSMIGRE